MKGKFRIWVKDNVITLVFVFIAMLYVGVISFFYDLGIGPDASNYLREANALLLGYGMNNHAGAGYDGFFGIWPIGFPAIIALVSFVTGLNVVYAAKIVMLIVYLLTTIMFIKRFKKYAWVYLIFMANPGYIDCMRFISSENIFLFAVLWFSFCTYDVWSENVDENKACLKLGAANLLAFLSRWVGAYTFAVMGMLTVMSFFGITMKKNKKKGFKLAGITAINGIILLGYLLLIKMKTGYMTGMYRIPSKESKCGLIYSLIKAENMEINSAVCGMLSVNTLMTVLIFIGIFVFLIRKLLREGFKDKITYSLVVSSVIYWCGYVYTRFRTDMEIFNSRTLLPATLPLFVALIHCLVNSDAGRNLIDKIMRKRIGVIAIIIMLVIFATEAQNGPKIFGRPYNPYQLLENDIDTKYGDVPTGSLVITEDWAINFLRMDLKRTSVFDCDSMQLTDIVYEMSQDNYERIYVDKNYLLYLISLDETASYGELFMLAAQTKEDLVVLK